VANKRNKTDSPSVQLQWLQRNLKRGAWVPIDSAKMMKAMMEYGTPPRCIKCLLHQMARGKPMLYVDHAGAPAANQPVQQLIQ